MPLMDMTLNVKCSPFSENVLNDESGSDGDARDHILLEPVRDDDMVIRLDPIEAAHFG